MKRASKNTRRSMQHSHSRRGEIRNPFSDVAANLQGSCGRRRRGIADIERVFARDSVKIVNKLPVLSKCLGANACGTWNQIFRLNFRNQALQRSNESGFRERPMDLLPTFVPMFASQFPKGAIRKRF